ncbi:DUF1570 domain-containing protein [Nocardioides sp. W7]|uniref:DUF1570 domain-containing protein n=1 Tax=Nocardioides sp. W7 TaxID=2931390 RepID=UPI001FD23FF2|nr:DUF1570 domain-containing protein [Nocardioides sp. W7]
MPFARSDLCVRAALAAALAVASAACTASSDDAEPAPSSSTSYAAAPDVVAGVQQALHRRARSVLASDAAAFDRGVRGTGEFREQQRTWFANLRQLPVGELSYTADPAALVREGDDYWVVVEEHLLLAGYDAVPVVTRDRYRFRSSARRPGRMVLTSVTDPAWEQQNDVRPQPWDLGPVEVRGGAGVLGVFDARSVPAAGPLLRSVERGIDAVAAEVPYDWSRSVVVYALSDPAYLGVIDDVPGGDPDDLDGVAFPVPASPGDETLAATRFALHPRMLDRAGAARDRLVRHELTHVALGPRDDHAPVWLSEGLAEYVSAQAMDPAERRVPERAIRAAEAGFDALPDDGAFTGEGTAASYALAWWACEYLVRSFDESVLWSLLDEVGSGEVDPDRLLLDWLEVRPARLARRAGELIVAEYGEPVPPAVPPSLSPPPVVTPVPPEATPTQTPSAPEVSPAR